MEDDDIFNVNSAPETGQEDQVSEYELAESVLPESAHKALARWAVKYRIRDDDPLYSAIAAVKIAVDAAVESGKASDALAKRMQEFPTIAQKCFTDGGADLQKTLEAGSSRFVASAIRATQLTMTESANLASAKLVVDAENAAKSIQNVVQELPKAIEAKRGEAVQSFADSAAAAALAAVQATKARNRMWAGGTFLIVLLLGAGIGGFVVLLGGEKLDFIQPVGKSALLINEKTASSIKARPVPGNPKLIRAYLSPTA